MKDQIYDFSIEHVNDLYNIVLQKKLSIPAEFEKEKISILRQCYNGIGPDRWSSQFRAFTTSLLEFFEAEAMIHDYEYSLPKKSYWRFSKANLRFAFNGVVLAIKTHKISLKTLKLIVLGFILALLCQMFGYSGYKTAVMPVEDPEMEIRLMKFLKTNKGVDHV